jgi:hypothetical protein
MYCSRNQITRNEQGSGQCCVQEHYEAAFKMVKASQQKGNVEVRA